MPLESKLDMSVVAISEFGQKNNPSPAEASEGLTSSSKSTEEEEAEPIRGL